jgi:FixJ family two-component response regulator
VIASLGHEIFIVDDDEGVRDSLAMALFVEGYRVATFPDGASFISTARSRSPACVLLDIYMPVKSGLATLKELDARNYPGPVLIMSGRGDIATAVEAIREGAYGFVEKRLGTTAMIARVRETIDGWAPPRTSNSDRSDTFPGCERLTQREREVLREIISGASSREVAKKFGISPRTIDNHRRTIMQKLAAKNAVTLACIVLNKGRHLVAARVR